MKLTRVIGVGSPFGDDQLGWKVVEALSNEITLQAYIPHLLQLRKLDRPGLSLLTEFQQCYSVILIDAIVNDGNVGKIYRLSGHEIASINNRVTSHHVSIADALELGKALNILPEIVIIYGMEIDPKHLSNSLSEQVSLSFGGLVNAINQKLRELLSHA
ncbi:hydrogenase maturation protease [Aquicella lusitana]|uniref:Hydrogenase maturation protease n=1 Tax=Aquicella lusitana TaxID=254246 RepID=A0A370GJJ4_9COXI|nr:hydrogenase maturation protease [Aquicella lusitana]RDI43409.1 hydrogenase maturation protease [Aquicella lusitana]VVC73559.1 hypothetical protein AQULUS_13020 [Aquicella lusitana]